MTSHNYFMNVALHLKSLSSCSRRQVGCVIVLDSSIMIYGVNKNAYGNCKIQGCLKDKHNIKPGSGHDTCRAVHAEQTAICNAAMEGISIKDSTLYVTNKPCSICAKLIVASKVSKVVYLYDYPDEITDDIFKQSNIEIIKLKESDF